MNNGYPYTTSSFTPQPGPYRGVMATPTVYPPSVNPYSTQAQTVPSTTVSKQPTLKSVIQSYPTTSLLTALMGGLSIGYFSHHYGLWTKLTSVFAKPSASASKPTPPQSAENIQSIEEMKALFRRRYPDQRLYDATIIQNYRNRPEIDHLTHVGGEKHKAMGQAMWDDLEEYGIEYFDTLYHTVPTTIWRQHPALQGIRRD